MQPTTREGFRCPGFLVIALWIRCNGKSLGLIKKDGDLFGGDGWIVYFYPTNGGNTSRGLEKEFFDILANVADRTSWFLVKTLEGLGFL